MTEHSFDIVAYAKSPEHVTGLRSVVDEWCREEKFWTFDQVLQVTSRAGSLVKLAFTPERRCIGVVLCDVSHDEAEIWYVYTIPDARCWGVGKALLEAVVSTLRQKPWIAALLLEVRLSNVKAIALYEKMGMNRISVRKRYYANGEDALVFRLDLQKSRV
jgi:ribosomal-protein-alanine N-acetyltransferase